MELHRTTRLAVAFLVILGVAPAAGSAQSVVSSRVAAVRSAIAAGQHEIAVAHADTLIRRAPGHPTAVLVRAIALAAAGRDAEALAAVRVLLRWDPRYASRAFQDSSLAGLRSRFGVDVDALAARADRPIARGHVWAVLQERDLVLEGTAWDPGTQSVLAGSLHKNKVVAIAQDGTVSDRVRSGAHGLGSVVGIHVDSVRGLLWVTSTPRFDTLADTATPAVFAFDVATGEFRRRVDTAPGSFPNDLTTGSDGTVYVTDSRNDQVLVLRPGADAFDTLAVAIPLVSSNGITVSDDGLHLFIASLDHVRVIALDDGRDWRLAVPDSINVAGIDGLAFVDGTLIAHHPLAYWRLARYQLDPAFERINGVEFFERNSPDPRTSTTGEIGGAYYYYMGNGQLDRMNARTIDSATMEPIRMYRVPLRTVTHGVAAVALADADSVALFDMHSLDRLATISVGSAPHEVAADPDGTTIYVANTGDSSITRLEIRPHPRAVATWRVPDGISVHDVAVGDDGLVWAASGDPPVVFGFDIVRGVVRHRHALQRAGSWMLDTRGPDGALTIANLEGGAVTLLEPATGRTTVFDVSNGEIDAAVSPDGREIWSVNYRTGDLTVLDSRSGHVLRKQYSGLQPSRVVFTRDGRLALVVHSGEATVVAYDVATKERIASVSVGEDPKVIDLSNDGRRAYITHPAGALTLIDLPTMSVLHTVSVAGSPDGVAVVEWTTARE
jgi:DNA-binding beta-propeller fold protein YncE